MALRRGFVDVFGCGRRRFARRRRAQFLFALAFFFLLLLLGEVALTFCECVVGFGQWTVFLSWIGVAKNDSMTLREIMGSPEAAVGSAVATLKRPISATRARTLSCRRLRRRLARNELRGIVEERLLDHPFALPALVGKLLHPRPASVLPFELETPANDYLV